MNQSSESTPIFEHSRFVESSPEITQKLELLTEGIHELQDINPDIIGATLFGSTLKGLATERSDYDTHIFIDANRLADMGVAVSVSEDGNAHIADSGLKSEYSLYVSSYLAKKMGENPSKVEGGIFITPLSHELIDTQLDMYLKKSQAFEAYKSAYHAWFDNDMKDEEPVTPETPIMAANIGALFRAELTPGLTTYRSQVLTKLRDAGQLGEEAWGDIADLVKFGEGHIDDMHYAADISSAEETYLGRSA